MTIHAAIALASRGASLGAVLPLLATSASHPASPERGDVAFVPGVPLRLQLFHDLGLLRGEIVGFAGVFLDLNETLHGLPEPIAVHIGVNSGIATVGATKIEGANGTRWTYTASGQVTIVAARLAALARRDEILVGARTRERLGEEFSFEIQGERRLRNVEAPVEVFRLTLPQAVPAVATA